MAEALAGDLGAEVVGAHAHIGGVGHTASSVGHSVAEDVVGGGDASTVGQTIGVSSVAKGTIAVGSEAIGISIGTIQDSGISLSLCLGLGISGPLAIVVSMAGIRVAIAVSVGPVSIGVSIVSVESISISLSLGLSISGPLAIGHGSIWVPSISKGGSSAGDGQVSAIHTGGGLATESIEAICVGGGQSRVNHVNLSIGGSRQGNCNNLEQLL